MHQNQAWNGIVHAQFLQHLYHGQQDALEGQEHTHNDEPEQEFGIFKFPLGKDVTVNGSDKR